MPRQTGFFSLYLFLASLALLTLLLAGCSTSLPPQVETVYKEGPLKGRDFIDGGVVLGGVVLAEGAELNLFPDLPAELERADYLQQSFYWSPRVVNALRRLDPDLTVLPFAQFHVTVSRDLGLRLLERHAQRLSPSPSLWKEVNRFHLTARYLLLARIERDELELDSTPSTTNLGPQTDELGRRSDERPYNNDRQRPVNPAIIRHVDLNLELFDLQSGLSVWEAWVSRSGQKRIQAHSPGSDVQFEVVEKTDGTVVVKPTARIEDAPPFAPILEKCLDVLLRQLAPPADDPGQGIID